MEWGDLAKQVIGLGAPILGSALGGPLGAAAGRILAEALDTPEATPAAVSDTLAKAAADPAAATAAAAAARTAEANWQAALAEVGKAQVAEVGQTQRAEIVAEDRLQRWWRPVYALELSLVECPAFALTLLRALWLGHEPGIGGFATLSGLLMAYFGARFGVLGVYVSGRSREKCRSASGSASSTAGEIVKALIKKK